MVDLWVVDTLMKESVVLLVVVPVGQEVLVVLEVVLVQVPVI